jgi:endoglucanase
LPRRNLRTAVLGVAGLPLIALLVALLSASPAPKPPPTAPPAPPAAAPPPPPGPPPAPPAEAPGVLAPLTVSANQIVRDGNPFRFHGVNRDTLEWGPSNWGGCGGDGHFTDRDFDLIRAWKVTAVRLPLSQAGWLGRRCSAGQYAGWVDAAVAKANARGMYAILDLHWSDVQGRAPCDAGCLTGQQNMPDADSLVFWRAVAARYANRPGVVFGLYNEPHDVSWSCWRDGGCTTTSSASTGSVTTYKAVGMQQLVDAIRAAGASNLVLAGGLDWAYDLSGIGKGYALHGANIAYDTHVYTLWHAATGDWDEHFGALTSRYPVVSTEFGSADCSSDASERLLRYFDAPMGKPANRMSWTIWSWNNPGSCTQPSVIADWNGTPMGGQGQVIKQALAAAVA